MHGLAQNGKGAKRLRFPFMVSKFSRMRNALTVSRLKQNTTTDALNNKCERLCKFSGGWK